MRSTPSRSVSTLAMIFAVAAATAAFWMLPASYLSGPSLGLNQTAAISIPCRGSSVNVSKGLGIVALMDWRTSPLVCELANGKQRFALGPTYETPQVMLGRIALAGSTNRIATTSSERVLRVASLTDGSELWCQGSSLSFTDIKFFPSGSRIAASDGVLNEPMDNRGTIRIFDANDGNLQQTINGFTHTPCGLAVSPDERWLCARFNYGGQVLVWNVGNQTEERRFGYCKAARGYVKDPNTISMDICHDSSCVAVGGEGAFGIWGLQSGNEILAVAEKETRFNVRFHPTESKLYVCTTDQIQVWIGEEERFVLKSTVPVQLRNRRYVFADDAALLCLIEGKSKRLTFYDLPD